MDKPACCITCGSTHIIEALGQWGPHQVRVECGDCGKFIKWGTHGVPWKTRAISALRRLAKQTGDEEAIALLKEINQW